jgi:hypothetical protein
MSVFVSSLLAEGALFVTTSFSTSFTSSKEVEVVGESSLSLYGEATIRAMDSRVAACSSALAELSRVNQASRSSSDCEVALEVVLEVEVSVPWRMRYRAGRQLEPRLQIAPNPEYLVFTS